MSQAFEASKSLIALDQDSTIIVVIEMSQSKCRGTRCARWCVRERPRLSTAAGCSRVPKLARISQTG